MDFTRPLPDGTRARFLNPSQRPIANPLRKAQTLISRSQLTIFYLKERHGTTITPQIQGQGRQRGRRAVMAGHGFSDVIICEHKHKEKARST